MSRCAFLVPLALFLTTCSTGAANHRPRLGQIYDREAQADQANRNPVILIPGILGSRLVAAYINVLETLGVGDYRAEAAKRFDVTLYFPHQFLSR